MTKQHVTFLHQLSGLKAHFLDVSPTVRGRISTDSTGSVRPVKSPPLDDIFLFNGRDGHLRRRRALPEDLARDSRSISRPMVSVRKVVTDIKFVS